MTNKYIITKADGSAMDPKAQYFMLRMDKDTPECAAAREAVLHFAKLVEPHNKGQAAAAREQASLCEIAIKTQDWEAC